MKYRSILLINIIVFTIMSSNNVKAQIQFGLFADCQYCDCEPAGKRYYKNSLFKLKECIETFNQHKNLKFVSGLGDLIDRNFSSFDSVQTILNKSNNEVFHVTGNHDFEVEDQWIEKVKDKLQLPETYHTFNKKGWQFIFLDGNEITYKTTKPDIISQAEKMVKNLSDQNKPNNAKWNGGIGSKQINWLNEQLKEAEKKNRKVLIFCHYPLLPLEAHTLWNSEEVLGIINNYNCAKAWINGHNHAGNYAIENGIHFITLKGMVDTETENSFAIVNLSDYKIEIEGFGREVDRSLSIK